MPVFVRAADSEVWHMCRNCPDFPGTASEQSQQAPPGAKWCEWCLAHTRQKDCQFC